MTEKIKAGKVGDQDLFVDVSKLIESRAVIQGTSGSGKSGLIRVIAERVSKYVPVIILDREGEFATLREKVDMVLVGANGDIATDLRSADMLARKLVELRVSAAIDLYDLKIQQQREYVKRFCEALINLPKEIYHPLLVIIDEAQLFCPEKGSTGRDIVSTQAVIDLIAQGRKRGFATLLATQRFSKVHNDALAELKNVFIGSTWLDVDQKRAGDYLGLTGNNRRDLRDVPKRTFFCFGPALSIHGVSKLYVDAAESKFPKPGEIQSLKLPKASDAIGHILEQLDDLPEVAEQEKHDIANLRTENARLKAELAERPTVPEPVEKEVPVEVPVMTPDVIEKASALASQLQHEIIVFTEDLRISLGEFEDVRDQFLAGVERVTGKIQDIPTATNTVRPVTVKPPTLQKPEPKPAPVSSSNVEGLTKAERLVLRAFFWTRGDTNITPAKIGFYSGYSHKSGGFSNTLSSLRSKGLLGGYTITQEGEQIAAEYAEARPSGMELREWLRPKLSKCENEVLDVLVANPGIRFDNETLAQNTETQYSHSSGGFSNALSKLRSLEAAEGYGREGIKAAEIFFE